MFVDRARIRVEGGKGGNGCLSFRREKYVPKGGPDGGDGGKGGDVVFVVNKQFTSLLDLHYHSTWRGKRGEHGKGKDQHGRQGESTLITVPPGTVIYVDGNAEPVAELTEHAQQFVAARGGAGGKGNARFLSNQNRAPKFAELGEPGEQVQYVIELKLIAEVGLVGMPNAGKSTFLSRVTAATPKIADYPFTTLTPNLGVAALKDHRTLTLADIPGIIEGAAEGKGLGHDFLRHIERTKVLLFLIDLGDPDPVATLATLESELAQHSAVFAARPKVIALNKADLTENAERFEELRRRFKDPFMISAVTGAGVEDVMEALWQIVDTLRHAEVELDFSSPEQEYRYEAPFIIEPLADGFGVTGKAVLRAVRMTDFDNEEAVTHLHHKLKKMGVLSALKRLGAQSGQTIHVGDVELEYQPD